MSTTRQQGRWRWRWWLGLLGVLALLAGLVMAQAEKVVLGAEAYMYGYPLVIMDVTREHSALTVGPQDRLRRVRRFPDAQFKGVVRPNVDTLYTTAFIDMAKGPWVFDMVPNAQRYEVMAFMDAWTHVIAAPGTRTHGTGGGRYLLVGPAWQGSVPQGFHLIRSPAHIVWLIGRTQTNGVADYPLVHRLQDGLQLYRLGATRTEDGASGWTANAAPPPPPLQQMQAMDTQAFFTRFSQLLVENPPAPADGPMRLKLERLGIQAGQAPSWHWLDRWSVALGRQIADFKVAQELRQPRQQVQGWSTPPAVLGNYGTHYNIRAVTAMVGLGANWPADAMYPFARVDGQGEALNGRHRYRLHFPADGLPPVRAFWSVTAYGQDDHLINHPAQRHAVGDRDPLVFNADGSLDILVQALPPAAGRLANWLPVREGEPFLLNARLYWPRPEALDGRWHMPAIERVD
jgi:hypothetical protein